MDWQAILTSFLLLSIFMLVRKAGEHRTRSTRVAGWLDQNPHWSKSVIHTSSVSSVLLLLSRYASASLGWERLENRAMLSLPLLRCHPADSQATTAPGNGEHGHAGARSSRSPAPAACRRGPTRSPLWPVRSGNPAGADLRRSIPNGLTRLRTWNANAPAQRPAPLRSARAGNTGRGRGSSCAPACGRPAGRGQSGAGPAHRATPHGARVSAPAVRVASAGPARHPQRSRRSGRAVRWPRLPARGRAVLAGRGRLLPPQPARPRPGAVTAPPPRLMAGRGAAGVRSAGMLEVRRRQPRRGVCVPGAPLWRRGGGGAELPWRESGSSWGTRPDRALEGTETSSPW